MYIITKSSVKQMIFITPVIVKYMENNLDIMKPRYQEHIFQIP